MFFGKVIAVYQIYVKRLLDIAFSAVGIILFLPVFLVIAFWIKADSKGPIFFKQMRIGKGKRHFIMYKFRTMMVDTPSDIPTHKFQTPDSYITRAGRMLRKTSLDETPQLWNVLKGNMSIIGPRPALWNQDDLIAERDKYGANDILPGLTGWAQINGRDELSILRKAMLDGEYVKRMSFSFDAQCFVGTVISVLRHEGIFEGIKKDLFQTSEEDKTDQ